jgi:hypothetical protein
MACHTREPMLVHDNKSRLTKLFSCVAYQGGSFLNSHGTRGGIANRRPQIWLPGPEGAGRFTGVLDDAASPRDPANVILISSSGRSFP